MAASELLRQVSRISVQGRRLRGEGGCTCYEEDQDVCLVYELRCTLTNSSACSKVGNVVHEQEMYACIVHIEGQAYAALCLTAGQI
jgi:hypothetical protein